MNEQLNAKNIERLSMGYKTLREIMNDMALDIQNQNRAIASLHEELNATRVLLLNVMPKTIGATERDNNN